MRLITDRGRERLRAYRRRRADDRAWSSTGVSTYRPPARRITVAPLPDRRLRLRRRRRSNLSPEGRIFLIVVVLVVGAAIFWGWRATRVDANLTGIDNGAVITPAEAEGLSFVVEVSPGDRLGEAELTFNGDDVLDDAEVDGDTISWTPEALPEGEYELHLSVPRPVLPASGHTWKFVIDGTPPRIAAPPYLPPHEMDQPVEISGRVEGADELVVNGEPHDIGVDGSFRLNFDAPPPGPTELLARDAAGNERRAAVYVPLEYPNDIHGVHVTAVAWDTPSLRKGVMELIDAGLVNTVVLSLKDEGGIVGHSSDVPLANRVGASKDLYDLEQVVDFLHAEGVRVTGRIVAFRDPIFASAAWEEGARDMVIQTPDGNRYGLYDGGFTNFAHPTVRQYNIDLAVEAVEAGVDDILWDYVRRPDGLIEEMRFPGLEGEPEESITSFLASSHERVRELGAVQGASVFGIAATRPEQIGQNILDMAGNTDYIAPMLYPSHWNVGEYGLEDPEKEPYEIIRRSMRDFKQAVTRTGRPLVPWLQHFTLNVTYEVDDIIAQREAAAEMGYEGWLMWDPAVTYNADALR